MRQFRLIIICTAGLILSSIAFAEDNMTVSGVQYTTTSKNTVCAYLTVKAIGDVEVKEDKD